MVSSVCSMWRTVELDRIYYVTVVGYMNAKRLFDDATIFERADHVPVTHMGYFKPNSDAFFWISSPRNDDRRRSGSI